MIDFDIKSIAGLCAGFGVEIDREKEEKLNVYGNLLLEWNQKMNLTAITQPRQVLYKHFYDCILLLKNIKIPQCSRLADVGTGAGFPGMVLKIVRPDLNVTLIDSLNKRLIFLNEVIKETGLKETETVHMRAEEAGKSKKYRESFDTVTARAVARLPVLLEYCIPLLKPGGIFVAMKGPAAAEEAALCKNAMDLLSCGQPDIICETLPEDEQRTFVKIKKISQTSPKYPRKPSDISKQPL